MTSSRRVYAFGVDLVDGLATSPPFDLRWVNVEHFGEMLRPEVTGKRSHLLLRVDSHDSNLALNVVADARISARLPGPATPAAALPGRESRARRQSHRARPLLREPHLRGWQRCAV